MRGLGATDQKRLNGETPDEPAPLPITRLTDYTGGESQTPYDSVTNYNNFYEFGTDKTDPARNADTLRAHPWTVKVEGEVGRPQVVDINRLLKWFPLEERIYRMRCVEAWSMVIPWVGFPLGDLLRRVQPTSRARYVAFTSLYDPQQMPGQRSDLLEWPYGEGLRIDEAMHPLTILAVGLYGRPLPNWSAAAAGGSLEIWIQGNQIDSQDPPDRAAAANYLESGCPRRIRILCERQSSR